VKLRIAPCRLSAFQLSNARLLPRMRGENPGAPYLLTFDYVQVDPEQNMA